MRFLVRPQCWFWWICLLTYWALEIWQRIYFTLFIKIEYRMKSVKPFDFLFEAALAWVVSIWFIKRFFRLNFVPHCSQVNPFSPVWWNICDRSWVAWMKLLSQYVHAYWKKKESSEISFILKQMEKQIKYCHNYRAFSGMSFIVAVQRFLCWKTLSTLKIETNM